MKFFLDTTDISVIREFRNLGLLDGVSTNSATVLKSGRAIGRIAETICGIIDGPVCVDVTSTEYSIMMWEAAVLSTIADNICVNVPLTLDGLRVCKALASEGRKVNVTLCSSPNQAVLAARAGATMVSPLIGSGEGDLIEGVELISEIRHIYQNYGFKTEILAAPIGSVNQVKQAAMVGADVAVISPETLKTLGNHPRTEQGLESFQAQLDRAVELIGTRKKAELLNVGADSPGP
jgi:transaldolase